MPEHDPKIGDVAEIANAIQLASAEGGKGLGRTVFFIGAGCSHSAGIPLVSEMAQHLAIKLARAKRAPADSYNTPDDAYRWLSTGRGFPDCRQGEAPKDGALDTRAIEWPRVYDVMFAEYYKTPDHAREIFSELVDQSDGLVNWAHLCLGELVKQGFVSTVLTTNFDQLTLAGLVRSGVLPVVCDGTESLTRIRGVPLHPQLIELHGSRHTYRLRNAPEDVEALIGDTATIAAIESLFQELRVFVVVGYGGRERGIMELLIRAATRFSDKQLFWIVRGSDPAKISDNGRRLLATSRNSALVLGQDADSFFVRLLKELGIGAPETMREPLFLANLHASRLASHAGSDIADGSTIIQEIARYREEVEALKRALGQHRERRTTVDAAIVQARELRLAGKLSDALLTLQEASKHSGNRSLWQQLAEIAFEVGEVSADRAPLELAVTAWRQVLATVSQYGDANDWASIQDNLGNALRLLGEREGGATSLNESVKAYREALKERTRERVPLEWARTQDNLGIALFRLGERESGTARLDEAVAAFRDALKERTRESAPLDWARTQHNLGLALLRLGERESSSTRLNEAVDALREVLKERTRERVPRSWAETQNSLGLALYRLGERESDVAQFHKAAAAFREAHKEWTREHLPLDWAVVHHNLGNVLLALSKYENPTVLLEEAVAAYREALAERTRDRMPLDWAMTSGNQGVALTQLAERLGDARIAATAVTQIEQALATIRADGHERYTRYYELQLPEARAILDRLAKA